MSERNYARTLRKWAKAGKLTLRREGAYAVVGLNRSVWLGPRDPFLPLVWFFTSKEDAITYAKRRYGKALYDVGVIQVVE